MLVTALRRRCPDSFPLPAAPLAPGATARAVVVGPEAISSLLSAAAREAVLTTAGVPAATDQALLPPAVLWHEGADALLVEVGGIAVETGDGLVSVSVPVRCEELPEGRGEVIVDFVVGTPERPTGMLAAATEPRGPRTVVRRWGDALTALAWQALLDAAGEVAAGAGVDRDGAPLVPTALACSRAGLTVLPQARHEIDRIRPGQVVLAGGPP